MKCAFVCLFGLTFPVFGPVFADYNPYYDNALADVRLHLVDEEGTPVCGVTVTAAFYIGDTRTTGLTKETGSDGIVEAKYPCNGEFKVWARKVGYYDTVLKTTAFITLTEQEATKAHRWSNGTVDIRVVLKKKRNPISLVRQNRSYWPIPATNEVVKLDLETLQWCPPYGSGRHADMEVRYEAVENPEEGWSVSYWRRLTLSMPNAVDGLVRVKKDGSSRFPYASAADTNAVFKKELVMEVERKNDRMIKKTLPADDEYFIFRTRTATNAVGKVTRANYGRIGEKMNPYIGLSIKTWFNPTPNDANLEDARPW